MTVDTSRADYGGYRTIIEEAETLDLGNANEPLVACPFCGTVLDVRARDSLRHCPLGHFETTAQTWGDYYGGVV